MGIPDMSEMEDRTSEVAPDASGSGERSSAEEPSLSDRSERREGSYRSPFVAIGGGLVAMSLLPAAPPRRAFLGARRARRSIGRHGSHLV
jgi:hypothetical protein